MFCSLFARSSIARHHTHLYNATNSMYKLVICAPDGRAGICQIVLFRRYMSPEEFNISLAPPNLGTSTTSEMFGGMMPCLGHHVQILLRRLQERLFLCGGGDKCQYAICYVEGAEAALAVMACEDTTDGVMAIEESEFFAPDLFLILEKSSWRRSSVFPCMPKYF